MDDNHQYQPQHIHQQVSFAPLHLLGGVEATVAPFSTVLTD
jgi:hypothetical protein